MNSKRPERMKKALSYRRVSTLHQAKEGTSLESQKEQNDRYAEEHGFIIVGDYADEFTGASIDRPGLQAVLTRIQNEPITALIALDSDRISRNPSHYIQIREQLAKHGCELHYVRRGAIRNDDFGAQLIEDIYGRYAQQERKIIANRLNTGRRHKVSGGRTMAARRPPFGYEETDGHFVVIDNEAEIVREIFSLYLKGMDTGSIAKHLSDRKIPTYNDRRNTPNNKKRRYGQWSASVVRNILTREAYTGTWYFGKRNVTKTKQRVNGRSQYITNHNDRDSWVPVEIPAIIDHETFTACKIKLDINKQRAKRNTKHEYLLQKRINCQCKKAMNVLTRQITREEKKYVYAYYFCSGSSIDTIDGKTCTTPRVNATLIDNAIWNWIKRLLSDPEYLCQIIDEYIANHLHDISPLKRELENAEQQIKTTQAKRDKLARTLVETDMAPDVYGRLETDLRRELDEAIAKRNRLTTELEQVEKTRHKLIEFGAIYKTFEFGLSEYDDEPFALRRKWVDALGLTVELEFEDNKPKTAHISCILFNEPQSVDLSIAIIIPRSKKADKRRRKLRS
ncbi:MAG: hypothetical protein FOGNACKC_00714 [Anaerolineae bacterium]|nr:hypothetical protein [Anaerolineae bacterium]